MPCCKCLTSERDYCSGCFGELEETAWAVVRAADPAAREAAVRDLNAVLAPVYEGTVSFYERYQAISQARISAEAWIQSALPKDAFDRELEVILEDPHWQEGVGWEGPLFEVTVNWKVCRRGPDEVEAPKEPEGVDAYSVLVTTPWGEELTEEEIGHRLYI